LSSTTAQPISRTDSTALVLLPYGSDLYGASRRGSDNPIRFGFIRKKVERTRVLCHKIQGQPDKIRQQNSKNEEAIRVVRLYFPGDKRELSFVAQPQSAMTRLS